MTIDNHSGAYVNGHLQSTPVDIFVPWNSPKEWSAFQDAVASSPLLSNISIATYCCPPLNTATLCGQSLPPMGSRWLGKPSNHMSGTANDLPNYGAAGDVVTFSAAVILNNPNIDKTVVYECSQGPDGTGVWNLSTTNSEGSCTPAAGVCAANSSGFLSLASPPDPSTLCGNESILVNLTGGTTGPWTWQCNGTPNMSPGTACPEGDTVGPDGSCDASCGATVTPPMPGACGPASGTYAATAPTDPAQLCSSGSVSYGPVSINQLDSTQPPYTWYCTGTVGGSAICQTTAAGGGGPPVCGPSLGQFSSSFPSAPCLAPSVLGTSTNASGVWSWTCLDPTGIYAPIACSAYSGAACGWENGQTVQPNSLCPDASCLCGTGSTPSAVNLSGSTYSWTCNISDGANVASQPCFATQAQAMVTQNIPNVVSASKVNGVCGASANQAVPDAPNINLCASGTASPSPVAGNGPWTWTCLGSGGGTNSSLCTAYVCQACQGNLSGEARSYSRSGNGLCNFSGQIQWTETDKLTSNPSTSTVFLNDTLGSFSTIVQSVSAASEGYCEPCYRQVETISGAETLVDRVSGMCPSGVYTNSIVPAGTVLINGK